MIGVEVTGPGLVRGIRVWYADGSVEAVETVAELANVPADGAIGVVIYYDAPFRDVFTGADWYYVEDEKVKTVPTDPELGTWATAPVADIAIKSAAELVDAVWDSAYAEMQEARTWP